MRRAFLLLVVIAWSGSAQNLSDTVQKALRGVNRVFVDIRDVDGALERGGVYPSDIRSDVEKRLEAQNIKTLREPDDVSPVIRVTLTSGIPYHVQTQLLQKAKLDSDQTVTVWVTTWRDEENGDFARSGIKSMRVAVSRQTEHFLNDWAVVNPKPAPAKP